MSTKEAALNIFNKLNEKQLEGFIAMFGEFIVSDNTDSEYTAEQDDFFEITKKIRENRLRTAPQDFDHKKELCGYLDERYGV